MKQGSYDRLFAVLNPVDTTDIGKIKWTAKGSVTVKNGTVYAKSVSKKDKKTGKAVPSTVTFSCGKTSQTIYVIVE